MRKHIDAKTKYHYVMRYLNGESPTKLNISESNGNHLVLKRLETMNLKEKIVHLDHGSQYSSHDFANLINNFGTRISII